MEILSTSSAGTCRQTNQMKLPETKPTSTWKNAALRNTGCTCRCMKQTIAPTKAARMLSAQEPPKKSVKLSAVTTLPRYRVCTFGFSRSIFFSSARNSAALTGSVQMRRLRALSRSSLTKSNDDALLMRRVCVSSTPSSNRIVNTISDVMAKMSIFFAP